MQVNARPLLLPNASLQQPPFGAAPDVLQHNKPALHRTTSLSALSVPRQASQSAMYALPSPSSSSLPGTAAAAAVASTSATATASNTFTAPAPSSSQRTPKVFASYLPPHYTTDDVMELFQPFEPIVSVKLLPTPSSLQLPLKYRCGFVQFALHDSVDRAIQALNNHHILVNGKRYILTVRNASDQAPMNTTNLMIKNLPQTMDEQQLRDEFNKFGTITSARIMRDGNGKSKSLAFVNFLHTGDALRAVQHMHNAHIDGRRINVSFAEKEYPYNVHIFDADQDVPAVQDVSSPVVAAAAAAAASTTSQAESPVEYPAYKSWRTSGELVLSPGNNSHASRPNSGCLSEDGEGGLHWRSANGDTYPFAFMDAAYQQQHAADIPYMASEYFDMQQLALHHQQSNSSSKRLSAGSVLQHAYQASGTTPDYDARDAGDQQLAQGGAMDGRTNVYVRNLHVDISDDRLKREFERFGPVTSCKVMRHTNGVSKRIAFVNFLHPGSAQKAIQSVIMIDGRQAYASYAFNRFMGRDDGMGGGSYNPYSQLGMSSLNSSTSSLASLRLASSSSSTYRPATPTTASLGGMLDQSSSHPGSPNSATIAAAAAAATSASHYHHHHAHHHHHHHHHQQQQQQHLAQKHPTPPLTPTATGASLHDLQMMHGAANRQQTASSAVYPPTAVLPSSSSSSSSAMLMRSMTNADKRRSHHNFGTDLATQQLLQQQYQAQQQFGYNNPYALPAQDLSGGSSGTAPAAADNRRHTFPPALNSQADTPLYSPVAFSSLDLPLNEFERLAFNESAAPSEFSGVDPLDMSHSMGDLGGNYDVDPSGLMYQHQNSSLPSLYYSAHYPSSQQQGGNASALFPPIPNTSSTLRHTSYDASPISPTTTATATQYANQHNPGAASSSPFPPAVATRRISRSSSSLMLNGDLALRSTTLNRPRSFHGSTLPLLSPGPPPSPSSSGSPLLRGGDLSPITALHNHAGNRHRRSTISAMTPTSATISTAAAAPAEDDDDDEDTHNTAHLLTDLLNLVNEDDDDDHPRHHHIDTSTTTPSGV
ncbi:hypothetical protein RI367_000944 [Sorochytrium milnesiophthora]